MHKNTEPPSIIICCSPLRVTNPSSRVWTFLGLWRATALTPQIEVGGNNEWMCSLASHRLAVQAHGYVEVVIGLKNGTGKSESL
jgi:hypothetical protein